MVSLVFSEQPGNPCEKHGRYTSTIFWSKEIISQRLVIKFGNLIDLNVKFRIFRTWVVLLFSEKPYAQLFCYFFVFSCTFFFIIYSYIVDVFFPVLLVVHMHIFIFDMISPCISVSLMIYLLFPQLLTTPKASLFLLTSEHQGSSSLACNLSVMPNY